MTVGIYDLCTQLRAEGITVSVRFYPTALRQPRFWVYYGYAPPVAKGLTRDEAITVVKAVAWTHRKIMKEVSVA